MTRLLQVMCILPIILVCLNSCLAVELDVQYEWKYIDYSWQSDDQKEQAIAASNYDHTKIITNDIQPLSDGRIVVTTPRYFANPASLSTISEEIGEGGPLLVPYPDWSWHTTGDCSGITSVSTVFLDDCNRLWLVDSGKIGNEQVCLAKILAFDADTDELIEEFGIPLNLSHSPHDESKGRLEIQVVETTADSCEKFWVYISDLEGYGMLIWDGTDIWRLDDDIFTPSPEAETLTIVGETVTVREGPHGLLITPPGFLKQPYLIWKTVSSYKTFAVTTEDLHNSKFGHGVNHYRTNFTAPSQEPAKVFSKNGGTLFANFATESAIGCWNIQNPLEDEHVAVLEQNDITLQYASSFKITQGLGTGVETLWVITNRRQKYSLGSMDFSKVNFRVMAVDVATYVQGTVCEPQNHEIANSIEDKDFFYYKTTY